MNGLLPVREDVWQVGGGGLEMCREGTREIAEGEGACSVHVEQEGGSNL